MPEFNLEHEAAYHRYLQSKQKIVKSQGQKFGPKEKGEAEIRWFEALFHHGTLLLPDPVVPAPEVAIVKNSADNILSNNEVYYSILRAVLFLTLGIAFCYLF